MTALLELQNVTRHFGGVAALNGVSLSVPAGAIVGLIGPNGSGKTTLMNVISGVDTPTSGAILLDGEAVQSRPANALARRGLARTFQHIRLIPDLTALQNVVLALHAPAAGPLDILLRLPNLRRVEAECDARASALLQQVGALRDARTPAGDLSYGDRRRIEIARALALEPRLLLLDEPAAGMTHQERNALRDLIAALPSQGVTVVLVEHDMDLVMEISDHVIALNFGRTLSAGAPDQVRQDPQVIEAYLGQTNDDDDQAA
jgi:branched-chain amino acid transport system ATP-binding protein